MIKTIEEYLNTYCDKISPYDFYRSIFPEGSLEQKGIYEKGKYNAIAITLPRAKDVKKVKRYTITDDLEGINLLCQSDLFCLMSPITYAGKSRKSINARFMYALAIDLDGIKMKNVNGAPIGMADLFYQFDGHGPSNYLPLPTYLVSSGTGLHLYYVFEQPIPLFENIVEQLAILKNRLTWMLWTQGVSNLKDKVQYESLFQGFRVPGTITKRATRAQAYIVDQGKKITIEYLNQFVPEEYQVKSFTYKSNLTLQQAKEEYPEWYEKRIVQKKKKGHWICKRDLYDWWKRRILSGAEEGHRYWCVMTLATYAVKCDISRDELEKDALDLLAFLESKTTEQDNHFTEDDILAALDAYDDSYITYPIDTIVHRTGIPIEKNKRNGRKQSTHLKMARSNLEILNEERGQALQGRKDKRDIVQEWRKKHPDGRKVDCIRDTGLTKPTVYKWWNGGPDVTVKPIPSKKPKMTDEQLIQMFIADMMQGLPTDEITSKVINAVDPNSSAEERARVRALIESTKKSMENILALTKK